MISENEQNELRQRLHKINAVNGFGIVVLAQEHIGIMYGTLRKFFCGNMVTPKTYYKILKYVDAWEKEHGVL